MSQKKSDSVNNNEKFTLLLPKQKQGDEGIVVSKGGYWCEININDLGKVSKSFDVEKRPTTGPVDLIGIPDMWARPLLFQIALREASHPLHSRVLGEWRGLLAMIALKCQRSFDIEFMPVRMPEDSDKSSNDGPHFLKTLYRLIPGTSHLSVAETTWKHIYLILFKGQPIGFTSPTTLVCTASYYAKAISNVSWYERGILTDPCVKLNDEEKNALAWWLSDLCTRLNNHPGLDNNLKEWIVGLINNDNNGFIKQLNLKRITKVNLVEFGLSNKMEGIFEYLGTTVGVVERASCVQLISQRHIVPKTNLLIVDGAIAKQWSLSPQDVHICNGLNLGSLPFSGIGCDPTVIGDVNLENGFQWRRTEQLFTDKLHLIIIKDALPGARKVGGTDSLKYQDKPVTPILPLKAELLEYMSADAIAERLTFEQRTDGSILCALRLQLTGPDQHNQGKEFIAWREYQLKDAQIVPLDTVPVLEIWPDFQLVVDTSSLKLSPPWSKYFTYYQNEGERTFLAAPYCFGETIETDLMSGNENRFRTISQTKSFPEAIICRFDGGTHKRGHQQSPEIGIIVLNPAESVHTQANKQWIIGVDFGTSATNIYRGDGSTSPLPMEFSVTMRKVTASGIKRMRLWNYFLPPIPAYAPFLSIFEDFLCKTNDLRPLQDGHIYFMPDYHEYNATAQGIVTDLKWSQDPDVRIKTKAFLKQLCMQCAAEAARNGVQKVTWRFSYPSAFSTKDIEAFENIWDENTNDDGANRTWTLPIGRTFEVTKTIESIASARFFAYHPDIKSIEKGLFNSGMICLDIGGGTTDISIYQNNNVIWQTSLRLAGRTIFLDLLRKEPAILQEFRMEPDELLGKITQNSSAFYSQADAMISQVGDKLLAGLTEFEGQESVRRFISLIALGLAGVFYYVGLVLRCLANEKYYEGAMPNLYIAGNGAKMFHWLAGGKYKSDSPVVELFRNVLSEASSFNTTDNFFITVSPKPKAEAAFGLVSEKTILNESVKCDSLFSGEGFELGEKTFSYDQGLTDNMLSQGIKRVDTLDNIKTFLSVFDKYACSKNSAIDPIPLDSLVLGVVKKQVNENLSRLKGKPKDEIHIEPIFITALKCLLDIESDHWLKRAKKVK